MYDLVIREGLLVDPAQGSIRPGNIGVQAGRIAAIANVPLSGREEIHAGGAYVCPGLIDPHGHLDGAPYPGLLSLQQGVTTTVGGNCGYSPKDLGAFFRHHQQQGYPIHQAEMVGHSFTLRRLVGLTDPYARATQPQIDRMVALCHEAFGAGACGLSLGLGYAPGSTEEEVLALCRVAKDYGRVVSIDTRMQTSCDLYSLVEALAIARQTKARVLVSHFVYQYSAIIVHEAIDLMFHARRQGLDMWLDSGMYTSWATGISAALFDEEIMTSNAVCISHLRMATGEHRGQHLDKPLFDHVRRYHAQDSVIVEVPDESAVYVALAPEFAMPSSDAGAYLPGEGHPQIAGSFPRFFRKMTREKGLLTWPEALRRATLLPAQTLGLRDRGRLAEGMVADLMVFDPHTIGDRADFVGLGEPDALPQGIKHVIVAGQHALDHTRVVCDRLGHPLPFSPKEETR